MLQYVFQVSNFGPTFFRYIFASRWDANMQPTYKNEKNRISGKKVVENLKRVILYKRRTTSSRGQEIWQSAPQSCSGGHQFDSNAIL